MSGGYGHVLLFCNLTRQLPELIQELNKEGERERVHLLALIQE